MNIAYLDPAYSRHFHHLAVSLARRTGGEVVALLSSPAYRLYTGGDRCLLWPPGEAEARWRIPASLEPGLLVDARDPAFLRVFAQAVAWLREQFERERIDLCLVFSDVRPFSIAARLAAEQAGVVCVWFERGAYRYRTSSLSTDGLNARFDLAAASRHEGVQGVPADRPMRRREPIRFLRLRFALFMAWNRLATLRSPALRRLQHKHYGWRHYLRLAWRQLLERHHEDAAVPGLRRDPATPVVLVPLQLQTDSQFLIGSPFADNRSFIDFVTHEIRGACPTARILVKKHPMDPGHYELPRGADWVTGRLSRLFVHTDAVVCVNSTVGFEAATAGKRVLCFGDSFYGSAAPVLRVTREDFRERLRAALAAGDDRAAGSALRAAVLRHYQAPGDAWAYTRADIEASAEIVLQHVRAARAGMAATGPVSRPAAPPHSISAFDKPSLTGLNK